MIVSLIVAMTRKRVIGRDNKLPWRIPDDLARFKRLTMGKPVIMGRKTLESLAKPLEGRINIVLTRDHKYKRSGCVVACSVEEALEAASGHKEIMVIGGADIYRQFLPKAHRLYVTWISQDHKGDTFFPLLDWDEWRQQERHEFFDHTFFVYTRRQDAKAEEDWRP